MLGTEGFGIFTYALTVSTILVLIVDYGFNIKFLKDLGPRNQDVRPHLSNILAAKALLAAVVAVVALALSFWPSLTALEYRVVMLLAGGQVLSSFATASLLPYKCVDRFDVEAKYVCVDSLATFVLCIGAAAVWRRVDVVALAYVVSKVVFLLLAGARCVGDYGWGGAGWRTVWTELVTGFPYATHVFVGSVYLSVDTLLLKEFVSVAEVGIYQAGMRLVVSSSMLLTVINSVLTPRLAQLRASHDVRLYAEGRQWLLVAGAVGGALGAWLVLFPALTVRLLYGPEYLKIAPLLWIFGVVIFLRSVGAVYGVLLTIAERQGLRTIGVVATLGCIVGADLWLIPRHKLEGAAWALLTAHVLLTLFYSWSVRAEFGSLFIGSGPPLTAAQQQVRT